MDISSRLARLLKAVSSDKANQISQILGQGSTLLDEFLEEWEQKHGIHYHSSETPKDHQQTKSNHGQASSSQFHQQSQTNRHTSTNNFGYSKQIVDDLHLFGLTPPVSLSEVKKVRNQEIKKFHPDKFLNDPEKMDTAKQIMQIYNAAYDRLEQKLK